MPQIEELRRLGKMHAKQDNRLRNEEAEACAKLAEDCAINSLGLSPKVKAACFAVAKRIRERINARAET